jgi:hypothetical protein
MAAGGILVWSLIMFSFGSAIYGIGLITAADNPNLGNYLKSIGSAIMAASALFLGKEAAIIFGTIVAMLSNLDKLFSD